MTHIKAEAIPEVCMGNLDAVRDWSTARKYVSMWRLQTGRPGDFVFGDRARFHRA